MDTFMRTSPRTPRGCRCRLPDLAFRSSSPYCITAVERCVRSARYQHDEGAGWKMRWPVRWLVKSIVAEMFSSWLRSDQQAKAAPYSQRVASTLESLDPLSSLGNGPDNAELC